MFEGGRFITQAAVLPMRTSLSYPLTKKFNLGLNPAPAWTAILVLIILTIIGGAAGAGKILNILFPLGTFAVGLLLYFRAPILYVGFTWWIWFLSPLVRRIADYRGAGFTDPSPILLAPLLATLISLITLLKYLPNIRRIGGLPFALSLTGVIYGYLVGLINRNPATVTIGLLEWLAPILFGFHIFAHWRDYPAYRQNTQRTLIWGTLIMGTYGVIQYVIAPEWDRFWIIASNLTTIGSPEPFGIRVYSTMNSVEPFSAVMTAGLLLLFSTQSVIRFPASAVGYLAFLLSLGRSAWLGWLVGLVSLAVSFKPKLQMRLLLTVLVMILCIVPLVTMEQFSQVIGDRISTLSDVENDGSAAVRKENFEQMFDMALTNYLGDGVGGIFYDNAILGFLVNLGWLGSLPYISGILLLVFNLFRESKANKDPFLSATQAIIISCLIRLPVNAVVIAASGIPFWFFLGIGTAMLKHSQYQLLIKKTCPHNEGLSTTQTPFQG